MIDKLPSILAAHLKWYRGEEGGSRANLSSADLRGADLSSVNLSSVDLRGADLRGADLSSVDLRGADLSSADLRGADLRGADLSSVDLRGANLSSADLRGADLSSANLSSADLRGADLSSVNLSSVDLRGADLRGADLSSVDLRGADLSSVDLRGADLSSADLSSATGIDPLPFGPVTLPDGAFRAYKLTRGPNGARVVATLEILEDAARVAPLTGRKCRASKVKVIALSTGAEAVSWHTPPTPAKPITYRVGEIIEAGNYNPTPFAECEGGIHFFISRREAEGYGT